MATGSVGDDGRILLLFDLNGVLVVKTRRAGVPGGTLTVRPGIGHLVSLLPHFRLGVYTSATRPTAQRAIAAVEQALSVAQTQRLRALGYRTPGAPHGRELFDVLLTREHCRPDLGWRQRAGGEPWDTTKPLSVHRIATHRCILIDDSLRKVRPLAHALHTPLRASFSDELTCM